MKKYLGIILLLICAGFGIPSACTAQIQYIGTPKNTMVTRGVAREDSAHEFAITDTSKHVARPGRMVSFLGQPYWWDGTRWYRLRGDTTTIPGQVNADWNATSGVAQILNKPVLATVATSGSYLDLTNKPTIPPGQVSSDWNAASGFTSILNKPRMIDSIWKDLDSIRIRVRNNDNTFRSFAIKDSVGSTGGSGTVLDVAAGNLSPIFGASVSNASTHPSISFTLSNAAAHTFLGNTTSSTGPPAYSTITVADLPGSIPVSKTLLTVTTGTGITLVGNNLSLDTISTLASIYDVSLKQNQLSGTGYIKQSGNTSNYQTNTQLTADINTFTTTLSGAVPAPGTVSGKVLSDNGTWVAQASGSGGVSTATGDASGTAVGSNLPLTLATVNSNVFASNTLLKHTVNAKGLITSAVAATATDITNTLTYIPFGPIDTVSKLATKYDLTKLDTVLIVPSPSLGTYPVAIYGRNDTVFAKRLINGVQNSDSSITVGNMIASNNLSDVGNKNSALNTILPNQAGNNGKVLTTDGTNTSWTTASGAGNTNISVTQNSTTATINSSTGTAGTVVLVNYSNAGLMSPGDKKRIDSTINLANTNVGDSIAYLNITGDTVWFKGINMTSSTNSLTWTKNHTQKGLSYDATINLAHANTWTGLQTFGNATVGSTLILSGTTYQASNGKLDYLIQDTTTGTVYRTPYIPIDTTGKGNGMVLTWNSSTGTAQFQTPGSGGTLTNFSAGSASPLFTTSVSNPTTTPNLTFTVTAAAANSLLANATGSSAAPTYVHPSLTSSLFSNQGTTTTVLKGNPAGNLSFGSVVLTTDVSGQLPPANGGVPSGGITAQALVKNTGTNYDYAWTNIVNSISGTANQVNVSSSTGTPVISLPQNINTAANTIFGSQTLTTGDLTLSRTDQANANILRPNTAGAKGINFSVVGGGPLDNFTVNSTTSTFTGNETVSGNLTVTGTATINNKTTLAASTSSNPTANIPLGVAVTSPNQGDIWTTSGHLWYRDGTTSYDLLASGGITNLNGLSASSQTFATGGSGTDFNISSVGSTHTFNLPDAGNATRGVINAGTQSIYGTKTLINAPILTTSSTIGQVWKATGTGGQGAWGTDNSLYNVDGTLLANRTVSGGNFSLALGTSGSPLSGLSTYSTTGVNITGGQYNNGQGSQLLGVASTVNNPITAASGTVSNYSSYYFQAPTITSTNTGVVYASPATFRIENAPIMGTNSSSSGFTYALDVAAGFSHFGVSPTNFSLKTDGNTILNGAFSNSRHGVALGASTSLKYALWFDAGADVSSSAGDFGGMYLNSSGNLFFVDILGNKRDLLDYGAGVLETTGPVTMNNQYSDYIFYGSSTVTFTLPDLATNKNKRFVIKNAGSVSLTIGVTGSDAIYDTSSTTSITIAPGVTRTLIASNRFWYAE